MNKEELELELLKFKEYSKDILSSKEKSEEFLKRIGVIDENGEVSINYKNLINE